MNTTDPDYYKWTQWIFLKLFETRAWPTRRKCPSTGAPPASACLANEEVVNGVCERCGSQVVRKVKSQWMLKITAYAQKLLDGLDDVDFIDRVKVQQRNWIGRSEGAEVDFRIAGTDDKLRVYTTRPDTLFGATYMVCRPEHPYDRKVQGGQVRKLRRDHGLPGRRPPRKSDFERTELNKDKTGVQIDGVRGDQPRQRQGDSHFGLRLCADDLRHRRHHGRARPRHPRLGLRQEVRPAHGRGGGRRRCGRRKPTPTCGTGTMVNSGFLNGLTGGRGQEEDHRMAGRKRAWARRKVNFKLRDWVF